MSARVVAALGAVGLAGNVGAVVLLRRSPHAYKAESLAAWLTEALATPQETMLAAVAFTVGLVALAAFFLELPRYARGSSWVSIGGRLAGLGAFADAVGTPTPGIVVRLSRGGEVLPGALAWLDLTIWLDATFNLFLGLGLILIAIGGRLELGWGRVLTGLGLAGGIVSVVVFGQLWSDAYAQLLALSGPLWLAFVAVLAGRLWVRGQA